MKPAKDEVTGCRLYHTVCGRALWAFESDPRYLWCDKCQKEVGGPGGVKIGRNG